MKKLAAILCLATLATGAFAQGLVNFGNGSATLISVNGSVMPSGAAGTYNFALFTAPMGTADASAFVISSATATNIAAAGRLLGGTSLAVNGIAPGTTRAILVRGWSANLGSTFDPQWLNGTTAGGVQGFFGTSAVAPAVIFGGFDGTGTLPTPVIFSSTAITAGFNLTPIPVPEPTSMALAGLGAAAMLIFRRRS